MPQWINRSVIDGSANGTNYHYCNFATATGGNVLIAIMTGSVTCSTPPGWTLIKSAYANTGIYAFSKVASSGEASLTTNHSQTNAAILGIVYEYPATTTSIGTPGSATSMAATATGPNTTGLTGTYSRFSARSWTLSSGQYGSLTAWTMPSVKDYDDFVLGNFPGGVTLAITYDDYATGTSFTPSSTQSIPSTGVTGEGISFALRVPPPVATTGWLRA